MPRQLMSSVLAGWRIAGFAALAVFVGLGGSLVFAHGGDGGRIHACVDPAAPAGSPNVNIVAPDADCRESQEAKDWNVSGPAGPQGPRGDAGPAAADQGPRTNVPFSELRRDPAIGTLLLPEGSKRFTISKTGINALKTAQAYCPPKYPKFVSGGYDTEDVEPAQLVINVNGPHALLFGISLRHGWRSTVAHPTHQTGEALHDSGLHSWTLKVTIVCKK